MSIYEDYQKLKEKYGLNSDMLWRSGTERRTKGGKLLIDYGNLCSYVKVTHSNRFKYFSLFSNSGKSFEIDKKIKTMDNFYSMTNELLLELIFEKFGVLTAQYFPRKIDDSYFVASPNYLKSICSYTTLSDFATKGARGKLQGDELVQSQIIALTLIGNNLTRMLDNEGLILQIMTPECYDKYVSYMLIGLFTFLDDEHSNNIILCKSKGSKKFDDVFVFDNESSAYCYYLSQGMKTHDIMFYLLNSKIYGAGIVVNASDECYEDKFEGVLKLIQEGKIKEKHIRLMEQFAELDYRALADEVFKKYKILPDERQLEMFQYSSDYAGEILSK